ncbi:MAG: methyltransferase domain-containing protein [Myxococcales bacterium]|nr:methyltransferase domain-containing protein [Myxococcales bacterium]
MSRAGDIDGGPLLFARKLLAHGTRVAALTPSSPALASAMCAHITPSRPQVIVELGAGTGAVTRIAADRMHPESTLIAVEVDADFAEIGRRAVPQAHFVVADVEDLSSVLRDQGAERADVVLSGLPVPSLPKAVNEAWLRWLREQGPDVTFHQLTVMPWWFASLYRRLFDEVRFDLVLRNLPPGGVYHCRRMSEPMVVPGK